MNDQTQLELAWQLRAELDDLVSDTGARQALAVQLDEALALEGSERDRRPTDVLGGNPETRAWMRAREDPERDRFVSLAGGATAVGTEFVCPVCDFGFVRENSWDPVPPCPNGHGVLVPEPD